MYTIQIYALSVLKKNINIYNLDSVLVYKGNDGLFRYIFGKNENKEILNIDLKKIKAAGSKNAFITKWNKFKNQQPAFIIKNRR